MAALYESIGQTYAACAGLILASHAESYVHRGTVWVSASKAVRQRSKAAGLGPVLQGLPRVTIFAACPVVRCADGSAEMLAAMYESELAFVVNRMSMTLDNETFGYFAGSRSSLYGSFGVDWEGGCSGRWSGRTHREGSGRARHDRYEGDEPERSNPQRDHRDRKRKRSMMAARSSQWPAKRPIKKTTTPPAASST
jgi:hypothetical protein